MVLMMAGINVTRPRGSGLGNRVMLNTNINTPPLTRYYINNKSFSTHVFQEIENPPTESRLKLQTCLF